jgi:hypothetical protein
MEPYIRSLVENKYIESHRIGSLARCFKIWYLYNHCGYPATILAEEFGFTQQYVYRIVRQHDRFEWRSIPHAWTKLTTWHPHD